MSTYVTSANYDFTLTDN